MLPTRRLGCKGSRNGSQIIERSVATKDDCIKGKKGLAIQIKGDNPLGYRSEVEVKTLSQTSSLDAIPFSPIT